MLQISLWHRILNRFEDKFLEVAALTELTLYPTLAAIVELTAATLV